MPNSPMIKSHWRKLVDSFRQASYAARMPEYVQITERAQNYRYYR